MLKDLLNQTFKSADPKADQIRALITELEGGTTKARRKGIMEEILDLQAALRGEDH